MSASMDSTFQRENADLELRDYLRVLGRRKWLIVGIISICVLISLANALRQDPVYEANAKVLLRDDPRIGVLNQDNYQTDTVVEMAMETEYQFMRSTRIQELIAERLGYEPDVEISSEGETKAINVFSRSTSGDTAIKHANDFARTYVDERRIIVDEDLTAAMEDIRRAEKALDVEVANNKARIAEITQALPGLSGEERAVQTAERDRLLADISAGRIAARHAEFQKQLDTLEVARAFNETTGNYVVSIAEPPAPQIAPRPVRAGLIGLGIGITLAIVAAFLRDYFDDTLRTKEDLDGASGGVPVLGIIPAIETWKHKEEALLETVAHPSSAAAEAFRGLRTSLEFVGIERKLRIIHVTSSTPGEGKSTTAANLAVVLARAGKRVVLLDCDLRKPRVHDFFDMANQTGFTSVLVGDARIEEALKPAPAVPGLLVLPAGPVPPNPSELLSTQAARTKIEALAKSADYVVIDSPPLLPVSDSVILAGYAHATLLVVRSRTTTKRSLGRSLEVLAQVDGPLEGLVFNGVGSEATYGYGYGYGYTSEERARAASLFPWRRGKGGGQHQDGSDERFDALTARERSDGVAGSGAAPPNGATGSQREGGAAHEVAEESTPAPPRP